MFESEELRQAEADIRNLKSRLANVLVGTKLNASSIAGIVPPSSGGSGTSGSPLGVTLWQNQSGAPRSQGTVVIRSGNRTFTVTVTVGSPDVIGVVDDNAVAVGDDARVRHVGYQPAVDVQGAVVAGQYLRTSATSARAEDAGAVMTAGCFAIALTAFAGPGAGQVAAYMLPYPLDSSLHVQTYLRVGSVSAPTNVGTGDLTAARVKVVDGAFGAGVEFSVTGDGALSGFLRVGSETAPTNVTAGDLTFVRTFGRNASLGFDQAVTTLSLSVGRPTNTTAAELPFMEIVGSTMTISANFATQRFANYNQPVLTSAGLQTVTRAATLYVQDAPGVAGAAVITYPFALWVDNGIVRLDGPLLLGQGNDFVVQDASVYLYRAAFTPTMASSMFYQEVVITPNGAGFTVTSYGSYLFIRPTAAETGSQYFGFSPAVVHDAGAFNLNGVAGQPAMIGLLGNPQQWVAGTTVAGATGSWSIVAPQAGTISRGYAFEAHAAGLTTEGPVGTVTDAVGLYVHEKAAGVTVTNNYGVYIELLTGGTLAYGIYNLSKSYFDLDVGIGIAPSYRLHVSRNVADYVASFENSHATAGRGVRINIANTPGATDAFLSIERGAGVRFQQLDAGAVESGYLRIGAVTAPTNVTAGDLTAVRGHFGDDGAFPTAGIFEVDRTFTPASPSNAEPFKVTINTTPGAGAAGDTVQTTFNVAVAPTAAHAGQSIGFYATVAHNSGAFDLTSTTRGLMGANMEVQQNVGGTTVTAAVAGGFTVRAITGTITNAYGIWIDRGISGDGGAIGTLTGIILRRPIGVTPTTVIGIDIYGTRTTAGTVTAETYIRFVGPDAGTPTITTLKYADMLDPTVGTITTLVGLDIAKLTKASTNIGIRNAATTVFTPSTAQNITAVGTAILADATIVQLTADASYTLTSAPTVADGQNGQVLIILNVDTVDTITLQDQGTLAGSNLRLSAATIALGPRDSIILVYNSTVGDWVQVGQTNVI